MLTAEQRAVLAALEEEHARAHHPGYDKASQIKGKARSGQRIRVGDELAELIDAAAPASGDEASAAGGDDDLLLHDEDDAPVSSRAAREAAIAARLGLPTKLDALGAHVAGSGVGYGRAGHSPERAYAQGTQPGAGGAPRGLALPVYKARAVLVLKEFMLEGDYDEARRSFAELDTPFFSYEFVRRALMLAMERGDREREMVSRLLNTMAFGELAMEAVGKGFERLFECIDDLSLDTPGARDMAAKFVARAVADEVLPPGFLTDPVVASVAGDVAEHAKQLLSVRHSAARLEHCWGVTAQASLETMKRAVRDALTEYYVELDAGEAARCLRELGAPYYLHEAVYRALVLAIDQVRAAREGAHWRAGWLAGW